MSFSIVNDQALVGELRFANVFADRLVLQRDKPVPSWGWADRSIEAAVAFADAAPGMEVRLTPEGFDPGRDVFAGVVTKVERAGGLMGELVWVRWNAPDDGGPPDYVPRVRAERYRKKSGETGQKSL